MFCWLGEVRLSGGLVVSEGTAGVSGCIEVM